MFLQIFHRELIFLKKILKFLQFFSLKNSKMFFFENKNIDLKNNAN